MEEDLKDFEIIVESRESTISEQNNKIEKLEAEVEFEEQIEMCENGAQKKKIKKYQPIAGLSCLDSMLLPTQMIQSSCQFFYFQILMSFSVSSSHLVEGLHWAWAPRGSQCTI
ncbi:hypothetical protein AVEN_69406-1 [Araneus ventricosus]|uniref:Uncharacterized protein n=1 Tax=Araneus ventricosus TaxID=182803 RepID=A0A4Y2UPB5_ARAVE|nr:hypothetical protein AVEN_69406-1 [Araneus ventricosus]